MVLENKLGIINSPELAEAEERISKKKAIELFENGILDKLEAGKFESLKSIHKYLFEDIYSFAGEVRTVNISKGSFRFAPLMYLEAALANIDKMPQSTHQTTVVGKYTNRYDVTLLINGLPLVQIELKRRGIDIKEAVNQIMRYRKHSYQGLYHFIQLFVVSNGVDTKYFANSDKDILYSHTFFWTDDNNIRVTNLKDFSVVFLARDLLIKMLTKFTILNDTDKVLMVMRPYQVYATEALIRQATLTNRNAYIWHTTGAGKTLTSFKTAQILASMPNIKKVIFLVDRKDLDTQTTEEFNKFEAGSVDATDRTDILVKQMKDKNHQLIITTIQKMATAVKKPQYAKVMELYRNEKVVFIIDECHRSQFGDMHKDIVRHFQKAQFFGFTGTPRFEVNGKVEGKVTQTTEKLFGECLHSYLIKDAIFDNNVYCSQGSVNPTKRYFGVVSPFCGNSLDNTPLLYDLRASTS